MCSSFFLPCSFWGLLKYLKGRFLVAPVSLPVFLFPQAEASSSSQLPHSDRLPFITPSPPASTLPPSVISASSTSSRSQQHDSSFSPVFPHSPPCLPHLTTCGLPAVSRSLSIPSPPSHLSDPSAVVPVSQPSTSPCPPSPVTSCPVSESVFPPPTPSPPKTASPPLSSPHSPNTAPVVSHAGRRSPKVKVTLECRDEDYKATSSLI